MYAIDHNLQQNKNEKERKTTEKKIKQEKKKRIAKYLWFTLFIATSLNRI